MSTECVSIKQEVDIEIAPELVNIKEEVDTESLFIKQEPEDDVLSNTNAYSETTEIAPKFVNTQLEVEKEPLFVKQEPGLDVLSNTNEACETEEIVPEFVSVKQEIEIECSEFSAIEMEVVTDAHQHQQQLQQETQRNIQSPQTRPYSNAERQRRYREKRKADKMNFCTTFSQSSDDQTQQEQPQHDIQINKRQPLSSAERQRRYRKSLREKRQQQQQMGDVNAITVQQKVDPAVLERKRQLNKQRQSRFRARQRFEWSSTSSHQGQTERVQSNVSPREYKQEFWEEQEINQRNRENENLQQTVKSETNSDSEDLTSNNESVEQTAFNHTMADQPDEPIETTPITDLQLPSMSYLPTIAAPKSNAQIHREYRQRIALTRTPEQLLAARKADAERQRKCRLRKVNLALKSNAQIQREYRQRKAESRTPEQVLAARKSDAERQRKCRQRQKSNYVQTGTRQQLTKQQLRTSAAEPAQITAQPGTSAHIEVQQAQSTWNTKRASSYKSTCLGNDFGACSFCDRLCYKKDLEHITAAQLKVTSEWSIKENRRLCTEEYEMVCHTCKRSLNKKSSAQIQREYRQRVAASRTPEQVLAARKSAAERQRKCRLRKDDNSTLVSGSSESTTASSFPTGAKSSDVRTGTQRQTSATEPPRIAVQPGNDFGHACSVCDRLYFKNDLEPITALQLEVISEWYIKENRRLCREEYEMACKNCKCSLDNKSMPPLAKEIGFSWRGEREGSGMAGSGEGTPRPHHTDTAER